jgi:hypothetical protein
MVEVADIFQSVCILRILVSLWDLILLIIVLALQQTEDGIVLERTHETSFPIS